MYKDGRHETSLLEEEYFYKKDRELIDRMHEVEHNKQELLARTAHYHKCACCGHGMKQKAHEDITFLQCGNCENVHFTLANFEALAHGKQLKNLISELQLRKQVDEDLKASA